MTVDLEDLVEPLRRAVNPPGEDLYPNATTADWVGRLSDAFWDARLNNFFVGYFEVDGVIDVEGGAGSRPDLPRELQQVIVTYAAYRTVKQRLLNLPTSTRSKAGPVEYEVQRSASVFVQLFKDLTEEMKQLRNELAPKRVYGTVAFLDGVVLQDESLRQRTSSWVR